MFDGVLPAQAMRILSWAANNRGEERQSAMIVKYGQNLRRIVLAPSNRNKFRAMAMGRYSAGLISLSIRAEGGDETVRRCLLESGFEPDYDPNR